MKDEDAIEAEIQAKGLVAPRLTPADIDNAILAEDYYVFPGTTLTVCALHLRNGFIVTGTTLTVCALHLRNGFIVTGESAAASPENFDEAIGRKIARENARQKIWPLEGYLLRERLASA